MDWEVSESGMEERARVFGGWILRMHEKRDAANGNGYEWVSTSLFVPDVNHEWVWREWKNEGGD